MLCATKHCGKPAKLQCPTCIKLNISSKTPSHFCSQDCFKNNWNEHKLVHNQARKGTC